MLIMGKSVLESIVLEENNRVGITLEFRDKVLSGIPQSGDMLDYFIKMKQMSDEEKEDFILRIQKGAMTDDEKSEMKETSWTTFEKDREGFCCLWHNNIKAMIREICSVTGTFMKKKANSTKGEERPGGRQTYQHGFNLHALPEHGDDLRIRILTNGEYARAEKRGEPALWKPFAHGNYVPVKTPHGYVDRIKHISDASGRRSAIGRHDFFEKARLKFEIWWVNNGTYSVDDLKKLLALGQDNGLGASRSQGMGRFDVTEFTVIQEHPKPKKKEAEEKVK
jgi:hypothetical protein